MLLTDRLIRPVWSPKCHHVHRCCVLEDVDKIISAQGLYQQGDCRNVTMPTVVMLKTGASGRRYRKITDQWASLNSLIVADVYAHRTGLGQVSQWETDNITNEKQRSEMWA